MQIAEKLIKVFILKIYNLDSTKLLYKMGRHFSYSIYIQLCILTKDFGF